MLAAEEDVEKNAERIHIGRRRHFVSRDLLGRRELRGQRRAAFTRQHTPFVRLEKLGDAEIEQLDAAICADENVRRFEVTMHDEVGVRVRHGGENIEKELDASFHAKRVLVAIAIDWQAVDVLEHQVRLRRRRYAGVDEARDVRMAEPREQAALALESLFAARRAGAHQRQIEQLDGGAALEPSVRAFREPDAPHAALADGRDEPVRADTMSGKRSRFGKIEVALLEKPLLEDEAAFFEKLRQIFSELEILATEILEPRRSRGVVHFYRPIEIGTDDAPAIGIEAAFAVVSCQATLHCAWQRAQES